MEKWEANGTSGLFQIPQAATSSAGAILLYPGRIGVSAISSNSWGGESSNSAPD